MSAFENPGRLLMAIGALLLGIGAVLTIAGKVGWLGRLPGDIRFQRGGVSFYFPLATSLFLSLLLTLLLNLFFRRR
jgi:membrane protein implicated in regulation of membrane protease activity